MVNIKLHGVFENLIKTEWNLNVKTVSEAFEAIEANSGKLLKALGVLEEYISHFLIYVDGKIMSPEYLNSPILNKDSKIEIAPLILGSDGGISFLVFLIILIISTGIQILVTKLLSPKAPKDIKNNSKLFSGYENVTKRNVSIPIGYGRLKIGSVVISNYLYNVVTNADSENPNPVFRGIQVNLVG
jgi:predicted phage tail protein